MSVATYSEEHLDSVIQHLEAMDVSIGVIDYVLATCKLAYAIGDCDGYMQALKDRIQVNYVLPWPPCAYSIFCWSANPSRRNQ